MPKIDWKAWAKMGFAIGLFWGIVVVALSSVVGGFLGGLGGLLAGLGIGTAVGIGLVIVMTVFGGIQAVLGRLVTKVVKFQKKKDFWKIWQVLFTGAVVLSILGVALAGAFDAVTFAIDLFVSAVMALVSSWIVIKMFKKLKWKLPNY